MTVKKKAEPVANPRPTSVVVVQATPDKFTVTVTVKGLVQLQKTFVGVLGG